MLVKINTTENFFFKLALTTTKFQANRQGVTEKT